MNKQEDTIKIQYRSSASNIRVELLLQSYLGRMCENNFLARIVHCLGMGGVVCSAVISPRPTGGAVRGIVNIVTSVCPKCSRLRYELVSMSRETPAVLLVPILTVLLQVVSTSDPRVRMRTHHESSH